MTRLHLFDLDGTLLHGSAAPVEISRQLGLDREIAELERDFAMRRVEPAEYARRVRLLWAELTEARVDAAFVGAPWLLRIRETWAEIRDRGEYCAVVSLSPSFFVERLTGRARGARLCERFGLTRADCVAYGDSLSDAELFGAVPVSVAVNADRHLAGLATHTYAGRDLWDAYELMCGAR
ncbi:HAD family hydrolase [Streptomyces sp. GQFP]|uniref:HAD family hydrolase n=1 Tax=Streptomyces sp. GQFP TaxID=2907545 RepID=UPI001F235DC4|nr:hydrolase [Streptomyces sp. GQFP]UIX32660.1 hydrolase [Streptomyces sp. GQFP]